MEIHKDRNIRVNRTFYDFFLENFIFGKQKYLKPDEIISRIKHISIFAYLHHTGLFYDARTENLILEYGRNLLSFINDEEMFYIFKSKYSIDIDTIFHVASKLYDVGGHTRVLSEMISRLTDKKQILFLTEQEISHVPVWFKKKHKDNLTIITAELFKNTNSQFEIAYLLRVLSQNASKIITYTNPEDIIPILAFSYDGCPVVLLENHSHSWFWFGSSISDIVFSHTKFHVDFTKKYRQIRKNFYLPFKFDDKRFDYSFADKSDAKKRLQIPVNKICITSIGTTSKFYPLSKEYNIFRLIKRITDTFENVYILIIGLSDSIPEIDSYCIDRKRVRFVGYQTDLTDYYLASDICIDAVPEPSLGATILSTWVGLSCPLFKYGGSGVFNATNLFPNSTYENYIGTTKSESELINKLAFLIQHSDVREEISLSYRASFNQDLSDENIKRTTNELMHFAESFFHEIIALDSTVFFVDDFNCELADAGATNVFEIVKSNLQYLDVVFISKLLFHYFRLFPFDKEILHSTFRILFSKRIMKHCFYSKKIL